VSLLPAWGIRLFFIEILFIMAHRVKAKSIRGSLNTKTSLIPAYRQTDAT
jgi:hypothetical protein